MSDFWSTSDFVYMCLRDRPRTEALRAALHHSVRPGDRVADVGSGSGILALMAAEAGAGEVFAVERDEELARRLRRTVEANGMGDRITVVSSDIAEAALPPCDVVVTEMIETGLIDEAQVPVHNLLVEAGIIGPSTKTIPCAYETRVEMVRFTSDFYGFDIDVVRHDWPFYERSDQWTDVRYDTRSQPVTLWSGKFSASPIDPTVRTTVDIDVDGPDPRCDGVRFVGLVHLPDGNVLGAMPAMNGDKVIPLRAPTTARQLSLDVSYVMGGGMATLGLDARPRLGPTS